MEINSQATDTMKKSDRIKHWQKIIDMIVSDYKRLDEACDTAIEAGALNCSGPLFDAIWRAFEDMLKLVDHEGWINWFIYENDCGAKGMNASSYEKIKMKPIKTTRHLAQIIVESEDSTP